MIFEELSILIVEDNKDELEKYISLSQSCGLHSFGASTLEEAKQMLSVNGYDILLTDIHLSQEDVTKSVKSGFELIQFALETQPQLTILAMSHDLDKSIFDKAFSLGASHFLRKPIYNSDEILIYIKMALQKKHSILTNSSIEVSPNRF